MIADLLLRHLDSARGTALMASRRLRHYRSRLLPFTQPITDAAAAVASTSSSRCSSAQLASSGSGDQSVGFYFAGQSSNHRTSSATSATTGTALTTVAANTAAGERRTSTSILPLSTTIMSKVFVKTPESFGPEGLEGQNAHGLEIPVGSDKASNRRY
ncbi:unnamed protein product [Protopolystoma xenopodis]|uniref:Uncharacterized protein n=1 Tax=Protopolystoma xenopodis TaxID=117903 RepID=A0A448WCS3_9PLAT|nr:unnamed protein product [Protopolystoma xenopodis]